MPICTCTRAVGWRCWDLDGVQEDRVATLPIIGPRMLDGSPKPLVLQLPVCTSKFCSPWKHHKTQPWGATTGEGLVWLFPAIRQQARNYSGLTSSRRCQQDAPSPQVSKVEENTSWRDFNKSQAFLGLEWIALERTAIVRRQLSLIWFPARIWKSM